MKIQAKRIALAAVLIVSCFEVTFASPPDTSCIQLAQTNAEVDECGKQLVPPMEARMDSIFQRLSEKFKGNDEMLTMLRLTRQGWDNYRNLQCAFESGAASGGQTKGPLPVEGNRAFLNCAVRTLTEMQSAMTRFQEQNVSPLKPK